MMRYIALLVIYLFPLSLSYALYDPTSVPNNKYGIHIADPQDILDAANLVNTNGDWGYITLVIQDNDRNTDKWQRIFDQMRRLHVIPIVRLATRPMGDTWKKPLAEDIRDWKTFLNSLNWPVENRYVILFNEPNHAAEWENNISPEEYADIAYQFADELKRTNEDFFLLPAGFDASAPNSSVTMDEESFLQRMLAKQPDLFALFDGWTSHSYPNPAFSGSPHSSGRGTLRTYLWELSLLRNHGVQKSLPIFISETGWQHQDGKDTIHSLLSSETLAQYLEISASGAWSDPAIVAITPFILNYQGLPFDHFSWRRFGEEGFYPHYYVYRDLPKIIGEPRQRDTYLVLQSLIPPLLVGDSTTTLVGEIKNTGQAILSPLDYQLDISDETGRFQSVAERLPSLEPGESGKITAHITTPKEGTHTLVVSLVKGQKKIDLETSQVTLVPPPSLRISIDVAWRPNPSVGDVSVLVYDKGETVIGEFRGLTRRSGMITVEGLKNIIPGNTYRIVILVPGYLPRQAYVSLDPLQTDIAINRLLPLDFNFDGALTFEDVPALFRSRPHDVWYRFFGP